VTTVQKVRAKALEAMAHNLFALDRRRRWLWSPSWLRIWPFWESDRHLRARVERARNRLCRRGTEEGMQQEIAEVMGCDPGALHIEVTGPGEFAVAVPRRLGFDERQDVEQAIATSRPACTRCAGIREGR
jgi:hypothetical protein